MQYYLQLKEKYDKLMEGRHGVDSLSRDMLLLWFVVGFLNGFFRSRIVSLVSLLLPLLALLRVFSTNSVKREIENRKYLGIRKSTVDFFKLSKRKFNERKTHKYYKCSNCSAQLRVRREKGEHTVVCPKCGKELHIKIR